MVIPAAINYHRWRNSLRMRSEWRALTALATAPTPPSLLDRHRNMVSNMNLFWGAVLACCWGAVFFLKYSRVFFSVPGAQPSNIRAIGASGSSMDISWGEVPKEGRNGKVLGYKVNTSCSTDHIGDDGIQNLHTFGSASALGGFDSQQPEKNIVSRRSQQRTFDVWKWDLLKTSRITLSFSGCWESRAYESSIHDNNFYCDLLSAVPPSGAVCSSRFHWDRPGWC